MLEHPTAIRPESHAVYRHDKMGKATLYRSPHLIVGLNGFEPGQAHDLHAHATMDTVYHIIKGQGVFLLEDLEIAMEAGLMLVAPAGVPHGIRNTGTERLLVVAILAPAPG